jgi:hypothetical protein
MNFGAVMPPSGLLAALAGACVMSLNIARNEPEALLTEADGIATPSITSTVEVDFMLPSLSDADDATAAFTSRPLLAEGRRAPQVEVQKIAEVPALPVPVEPSAPVAAAQPPERPQIIMIGMMAKDNSVSVLVRDLTTGEEHWLQKGELIGSWTLAEITQGAMRLEAESTEITFNLFQDGIP